MECVESVEVPFQYLPDRAEITRRAPLRHIEHEPFSIIERILDLVGVLTLLALFLVFFDPGLEARDSAVFSAIRYGGFVMAPVALGALLVMFFLAGHPDRLHAWLLKAEAVFPSRLAAMIARFAKTFVEGFGVVRRPERLIAAVAWSIVLWMSIAAGIWAVTIAFGIAMPFTGAWLMLAPLIVGVAVPTPGGVGSFHEAYRFGMTSFFAAPNASAVAAASPARRQRAAPERPIWLSTARSSSGSDGAATIVAVSPR